MASNIAHVLGALVVLRLAATADVAHIRHTRLLGDARPARDPDLRVADVHLIDVALIRAITS